MNHPLDAAYLRVGRARHHLDELRREVEKVRCAYEAQLPSDFVSALRDNPSFQFPKYSFPPLCSILIGETAYNLRAALDYLVYELAWSNLEHEPEERTQFPDRRKGVSDKHSAMLSKYDNVEWFSALADVLNNPDKHRRLTGLPLPAVGVGITYEPSRPPITAVTLRARLADDTNFIELLQNLEVEVTAVLDEFRHQWKLAAADEGPQ
jgi:hypothetical protein